MKDAGEERSRGWFRSSFIVRHSSLVIAFFLGAATVAGFAPLRIFLLPVLTLAALFVLWLRAGTARRAAALGFAYGLGLFLFGTSWVYVSLHDFGGMPAPLAAFATLLFCAIMALLPAAAGYASVRVLASPAVALGVLAPAFWTLAEWVRSWLFTGFPWLATGYSQIPSSVLAGFAPILGIYGVTLATAVTAGLLAMVWERVSKAEGGRRKAEGNNPAQRLLSLILHPSSFILLALWASGWALKQITWTEPIGPPISVSLIQGNVAQDLKWREDRVRPTLEAYRGLVERSRSRLIVLPETALPLFLQQVPQDYLAELAAHARRNGGDLLIGVAERSSNGDYFNSVVSYGTASTQRYRKSHLVPFGEFIPLRPVLAWIVNVLAIPLQDFSRGREDQRPLAVAGQRVAVNICYEDVFGEEIIRQLPEATLLVNVSNVAWFGRSIAPQQHLQISQARALESGRYMLRATNTGVTAIIDPRGKVLASAPEFTTATVSRMVQGYAGSTPYLRWGNYAVLVLCAAMAAGAIILGRKGAGRG
ncbi:MAG: apolipoprotein N-acyltransferase [Betaproteobacteria bacterium]|nr:apolipoprotein N-acyltransferase [Betaproteobacteria bacterium]